MRAVDTNVLVRALVQDDARQSARAAEYIEAAPVYIPVTVVLELEWVLRSRYGFAPRLIADAIEKLTTLDNALMGERAAVASAAARLRQGWDFADALHHALSDGCEAFATFDEGFTRRARRATGIEPPVVRI